MRCVLFSAQEIIRDDLGIANELLSYAQLVLQSDAPVSVRLQGFDVLLTPIDTIAGRLVLGLLKDEPFNDAVRCYIDEFLISQRRWPATVERIASQLEQWRGKRYVAILSAKDFAHRYAAREKLGPMALTVMNLGPHDLYVFSTETLPPLMDVKLCVSGPCEDPRETVRQALIVERYVQNEGVFFYERLFEYTLNVRIEDSDASVVLQRLLSTSLQDFANRLNVSVSEAFRRQKEIEEKYLLRFDVGLECHLYAQGLAHRKVERTT